MGTNNIITNQNSSPSRQIIHGEISTSYSGPLPQAEEFRKYEEVCPGAADRIISMAEKQALHRQSIEKSIVKANNKNSFAGIVCATVISLSVLFGGVYCIIAGHDWAGGTLVTLDIVSLCAVFIYGTNLQNKK